MICIGLLVAWILPDSPLRNPLKKMFLPENVIFGGLRFSLGHFGQQAPDSHVSQLQNGVSKSFLPPFIVDIQGCIFRLTCSHPELTEDHVLTSAYVKIFRTVTRNAVNKGVWRKKRLFLTSLKQICNEYLIKFSENQSAPELENRKTSPCSPFAPNLLHVLVSRIPGYHNLCSPGCQCLIYYDHQIFVNFGTPLHN